MRPVLLLALMTATGLAPSGARASFDEFGEGYIPASFTLNAKYLTLVLKGEIELELHDLEGEGGPGHDSPTDTKTLGTRSPFVEIDTFSLSLRVGFAETVWVYSILDFTMSDASVGAVFVDYRGAGPDWLEHHVEAGYNTPIVRIDRRTERQPLAASIYWRQPEVHLAWEGVFALASHVTLEVGASAAMMRPLGFATVQDSTAQASTINVLAYDRAATFSGNGGVYGGRLRLEVWGAFVDAFGFGGGLVAESGTDVLRSGFSNYRDLPGYDADQTASGDFYWFGGRVGYSGYGVSVVAEAVGSREDLLVRWTAYGQVGYRAELRGDEGALLFRAIEPVVRYEAYRIEGSSDLTPSGRALRSTAPINAVSWDFDVLTVAVMTEVWGDFVKLRIEYTLLWEQNGVPALGISNAPFRNDELVVQAELRF